MFNARMSVQLIAGLVILVFPLICVAVECDMEPVNTDARLRKDLFCRYDKSVIPVKKTGTKVDITVMMAVKAFNFNDDANTLDVSSWLVISWTDEFLHWTPATYDGMRTIVASSDLMWQPELALYNSDVVAVESQFCRSASCVLDHNGTVQCIPPCLHTAYCDSDYLRWPFDTQNCSLHFGTWVHDSSDVDFVVQETQIAGDLIMSQNREWRMLMSTYKYHAGRYENVSYPTLEYSFLLERHSGAHAMVLLGPAMVLVTINLLTLWLSPSCVERLALVSVNVFFHFIYLQQMSWYVPSNGDTVPLVVRFFETSLWLTAVLLTVAVVSRGLSQSRAVVPDWIGAGIAYVDTLRFGRVWLRQSYLVESQPLNADSLEETTDGDDATTVDLSDVQTGPADRNARVTKTPKDDGGKKRTVAQVWRTVVRLIDGCLFVVFALVYVLMMVEWLPEGYLTKPKSSVVIVHG